MKTTTTNAPRTLCAAICLIAGALPLLALAAPPAASAPAGVRSEAAPTPADKNDEGDRVTLDFVNADIGAVIRAIGQFTGRTFIIDPRVKGTLTLVSERPVTRRQAYDELLSALRMQGFTLVESPEPGGIARVVLEADAKLQGSRVVAPAAVAPAGDQVVTQVFRLQYASASNLVPVLRPIIAPNNTITAYPADNSLVITDYAANLRRLAQIIEAIDTPASARIAVLPLQHAIASDLAALLDKILNPASHNGPAADPGQRVLVKADPRTNSLIVQTASPARLQQVKTLVARFDMADTTPGNIHVVYLRNAQAVKLAPLLRAILSSDPTFLQKASAGTGLSPGGSFSGNGASGGSAFGGSSMGTNSLTGSSSGGASSGGGSTGGGGSSGGGGGESSGGSGAGGPHSALAGLIQADPATNSLIVSAPDALYRNIRVIIDRLDERPAQVLIESLVVQLSGDTAAQFGIQWQSLHGLSSSSTAVIGGTNFGGIGQNIIAGAQNLTSLGQGLNIGVVRGTVNIPGVGQVTNMGMLASALESIANANILSRPNILTLDNEEGKFLVGQNIGLLTGSYASTGIGTTTAGAGVLPFNTYERQDVGLQLRVKPQVSAGGRVRLSIYIEDSSVVAATAASGNPTLNKSSFETSVIVDSGSFVVISGMIQDQATENLYKVPVLGDIPYLGALFRYDSRERIKTQTLVFLRPTVLRTDAESSAVALDRYDYIRGEIAHSAPPHSSVIPTLAVDPLPPPGSPGAPGGPVLSIPAGWASKIPGAASRPAK